MAWLVVGKSSVTSCAASMLFVDAGFTVNSSAVARAVADAVLIPEGREALLDVLVEGGEFLLASKGLRIGVPPD